MESKRKSILFASGVVLLALAFFEFLPAGPWLDASFSRGISGLLGMSLLYLSWYEHVFNEFGVIPSIEKWRNPQSTWSKTVAIGIACIALSWLSGQSFAKEVLPEPSGILLMLVGLLVTYTGLYAFLVTKGPLKEEE